MNFFCWHFFCSLSSFSIQSIVLKMCICDSLHHRIHILAIFPSFLCTTSIVNHPLLLLPLLIFYLRHRRWCCWRHCNCAEGFFLLVLTCMMMKRNFFMSSVVVALCSSNCLQTYRVNYVIERFFHSHTICKKKIENQSQDWTQNLHRIKIFFLLASTCLQTLPISPQLTASENF